MSRIRWGCGLAAAVVMLAAARGASAEEPDPRWRRLQGHAVVVEKQDGGLVAGKLASVEEGRVEVLAPDGGRTVVERTQIKALRSKLHGEQVTVTMTKNDEKISGKLTEQDEMTVVVETDDGRRVTIERASIKTVRARDPNAPPAPSRPASGSDGNFSGGGHRTNEGTNEWDERPSTGKGLIIAGGVFLGIGLVNLVTSPICKLNSSIPPDTQDVCWKAALGVSGASTGLGVVLLLVGVKQRAAYGEWERRHFSFVPTRGGGALTWQGSF